MFGVPELLGVPGPHPAAAEAPLAADSFVRVEVRQGHVEPVLRFEDVVVSAAIHDAVRVIVAVEVDHVVADEVHRTMEVAE